LQLIDEVREKSKRFPSNIIFNLGNDKLFDTQSIIVIEPLRWDNGLIIRRMNSLITSGIYHQFKKMEGLRFKNYHERKDAINTEPSALNLNSNILTMFAIFAVCIGASAFWLSIECIFSVSQKVGIDTLFRLDILDAGRIISLLKIKHGKCKPAMCN
jgi:hypothetical protein